MSDVESDGKGVKLHRPRVNVPGCRLYLWKPERIEPRSSSTKSNLFEQYPSIRRIRQHRNFTFHAFFRMPFQPLVHAYTDASITALTRWRVAKRSR